MFRKRMIIIIIGLCLLISGCSFSLPNKAENMSNENNAKTDSTDAADVAEPVTDMKEPLTVSSSSIVTTNKSIKNSSLICLDNKAVGILTVNKVEKLGIWDWYNKEAVAANVRYSYAINISIDLTTYFKNRSDAKIVPEVYLVDENDSIVGNTCNVGWSGFNQQADLFSDSTKAVLEIGVQPIKQKLKNYKIKICLVDETNDQNFDPIYYSSAICKKAKKGAKILDQDDVIKIKSINGGKYRVRFKDIYKTTHSLLADNNVKYDFYDMTWIMNYLSKPTNKRSVGVFDPNNRNKLSPSIQFYVTSDTDPTELIYSETSATQERQDEWGSASFNLYCTSTKKSLSVGDSFAYRTNRQIPSSTVVKPSYIRIHMVFDDEAKARKTNERMKFNGRYVVLQVPIKEVDELNE